MYAVYIPAAPGPAVQAGIYIKTLDVQDGTTTTSGIILSNVERDMKGVRVSSTP